MLLRANSTQLVLARDIAVGDVLPVVGAGEDTDTALVTARVRSVRRDRVRRYARNPITATGYVIVDGVVASMLAGAEADGAAMGAILTAFRSFNGALQWLCGAQCATVAYTHVLRHVVKPIANMHLVPNAAYAALRALLPLK